MIINIIIVELYFPIIFVKDPLYFCIIDLFIVYYKMLTLMFKNIDVD